MSRRPPRIAPRKSKSTKTMIERVEKRFDLKPQRLIGDTAYGTGAMLGWMVEEQADRAAHAGLGQDRTPGRNV